MIQFIPLRDEAWTAVGLQHMLKAKHMLKCCAEQRCCPESRLLAGISKGVWCPTSMEFGNHLVWASLKIPAVNMYLTLSTCLNPSTCSNVLNLFSLQYFLPCPFKESLPLCVGISTWERTNGLEPALWENTRDHLEKKTTLTKIELNGFFTVTFNSIL